MLDDSKENKREVLQRYLESLASQPPRIPKSSSPRRQNVSPSSPAQKHNPSPPLRRTSTPPKRQGSSSRQQTATSAPSISQTSQHGDLKQRRQQSRQSLALTPQRLTPNPKSQRNPPVPSALSSSTSYRTPVPSPFSASRKLSRSPNPQTPDVSLNGPKWPDQGHPPVPGLELAALMGEDESSQSLAPSSSVTLPTSSSTYRASTRNSKVEDVFEERAQGGSRMIPEPEDL